MQSHHKNSLILNSASGHNYHGRDSANGDKVKHTGWASPKIPCYCPGPRDPPPCTKHSTLDKHTLASVSVYISHKEIVKAYGEKPNTLAEQDPSTGHRLSRPYHQIKRCARHDRIRSHCRLHKFSLQFKRTFSRTYTGSSGRICGSPD